MPDTVMEQETMQTREKAPDSMSFSEGLLSDTASLARDDSITQHSFMDRGEAQIAQDQHRTDVANGVKNTLRSRMEAENMASRGEAEEMKVQFEGRILTQMNRALSSARQAAIDAYKSKVEYFYYRALHDPSRNMNYSSRRIAQYMNAATSGNGSGEFARHCDDRLQELFDFDPETSTFFGRFWAGRQESSAQSDYKSSFAEAQRAAASVSELCDTWNNKLKEYHDEVYKPRSKSYDKYAMMYYTVTRDDADRDNGAVIQDADTYDKDRNTFAKDIYEYVVRFSKAEADNFINVAVGTEDVLVNPFEARSIRYGNLRLNDGSKNFYAGGFKHHTQITTEAFSRNDITTASQEQSVPNPAPRRRIKLDSHFRGYEARRQPYADGTLPQKPNPYRQSRRSAHRKNVVDAATLGLTADEMSKTGDRLFSQKSAKIYTAKAKNGQVIEGFFIGGEFIPADDAAVRAAGGYAFIGTPNWKKVAKQERLRTAIRRSDFFRHVNAATIQYYMRYDGYNPDRQVKQKRADEISGDFMARRDSTFSFTNIGQSFLDGTITGIIGDLAGTVNAGALGFTSQDEKKTNDRTSFTKAAYTRMISDYTALNAKLLKLDTNADRAIAAASVGADVVTAAMLALDSFGPAMAIGRTLQTIVDIAKNLKAVVNALDTSDADDKGTQQAVFAIIDCIIGFGSDLAAIGYTLSTFEPSGIMSTVMSFIKDTFTIIKSSIVIHQTRMTKNQIDTTDSEMDTALKAFKGQGEGTSQQRELGSSLSQNSQSRFYLSLARSKANRDQVKAGFDVATAGLNMVGNAVGVSEKATWVNPTAAAFKVASKVSNFIGMVTGKLMARGQRKDIVGTILGDRELDGISGFDDVLAQETGIRNKYYLTDLAKVFMAIDMHAMATNNTNSDADEKVVEMTLKTVIPRRSGEQYSDYRQRIKLSDILTAVGASGNWRSVLFEAIRA